MCGRRRTAGTERARNLTPGWVHPVGPAKARQTSGRPRRGVALNRGLWDMVRRRRNASPAASQDGPSAVTPPRSFRRARQAGDSRQCCARSPLRTTRRPGAGQAPGEVRMPPSPAPSAGPQPVYQQARNRHLHLPVRCACGRPRSPAPKAGRRAQTRRGSWSAPHRPSRSLPCGPLSGRPSAGGPLRATGLRQRVPGRSRTTMTRATSSVAVSDR